jgi:hypothetical protein
VANPPSRRVRCRQSRHGHAAVNFQGHCYTTCKGSVIDESDFCDTLPQIGVSHWTVCIPIMAVMQETRAPFWGMR